MNAFLAQLRGAVVATLVLAAVTCGLYPLAVWGIAQTLFPDQANGSLIVDSAGIVRGSRLLGQGFTAERYFHPRPSAAGANGYDAASSGGSHLGPTSQKLSDQIRDRIAAFRLENGLRETDPVPADAVTASGSGLDPHISIRNAELQAARVARVRGIPREALLELVRANTTSPSLGILGERGVHVLMVNLALDAR
ncbi:MAG: K(+)-transporting ATPase subunit [Verrucomicrobiota bacterium]|jgi:K+-transporting ATPase ATPase C chain